MSKQDQAAKAIKFGSARGYTPEQIATLLNELNLLATDLPGPRTFPDTGEYEWHMKDGYVSLEDGIIHVIHDETDEDWEPAELEPDCAEIRISDTSKARENAYAILAACDLKETTND